MMTHLTFLRRCQDLKLVPLSLTLKLLVNSRRAQQITKRAEHELVWDRIYYNCWRKHQQRSKFSSKFAPFLERISLIEDKTQIQQYLDKSYKNLRRLNHAKLTSWRKWKSKVWKSKVIKHQWKPLLTSVSTS